MKKFIKEFTKRVKESANLAWKGKENLNVVLWYWGIATYAISYFVISKFIIWNSIQLFNIIISLPVIIYFIWHIIVVKRCSPKKKKIDKKAEKEKFNKLSKEEQQRIKKQKARDLRRERIDKYILLRKPIGNFKLPTMVIITDLYIILLYINYILK